MIYAFKSVVGKRETNEDSCIIREYGDALFAAVADGMGGCAAGEVASRAAIDTVTDELSPYLLQNEPEKALMRAINEANLYVYRLSRDNPSYRGMGSTLVCACICDGVLTYANVGDSRIYMISNGSIRQLSKDHSLVAELLATGSITEREAKCHPLKNLITRSVGNELSVKADIASCPISGEQSILLCSDGLHGTLTDAEILSVCQENDSPLSICEKLVAEATIRGSSDNITAVFVSGRNEETV